MQSICICHTSISYLYMHILGVIPVRQVSSVWICALIYVQTVFSSYICLCVIVQVHRLTWVFKGDRCVKYQHLMSLLMRQLIKIERECFTKIGDNK